MQNTQPRLNFRYVWIKSIRPKRVDIDEDFWVVLFGR